MFWKFKRLIGLLREPNIRQSTYGLKNFKIFGISSLECPACKNFIFQIFQIVL